MTVAPKPPRGTVYIVGRVVEWPLFQLGGVFTQKERAVAACNDESYFVGPARLDKPFPKTLSVWPGLEYPRQVDGAP